jgi:hypothetical protein
LIRACMAKFHLLLLSNLACPTCRAAQNARHRAGILSPN